MNYTHSLLQRIYFEQKAWKTNISSSNLGYKEIVVSAGRNIDTPLPIVSIIPLQATSIEPDTTKNILGPKV